MQRGGNKHRSIPRRDTPPGAWYAPPFDTRGVVARATRGFVGHLGAEIALSGRLRGARLPVVSPDLSCVVTASYSADELSRSAYVPESRCFSSIACAGHRSRR